MTTVRMRSEAVAKMAQACIDRLDADAAERYGRLANRVRARLWERLMARIRGRTLTDKEAVAKIVHWWEWDWPAVRGDARVASRLLYASKHADEMQVSASDLQEIAP